MMGSKYESNPHISAEIEHLLRVASRPGIDTIKAILDTAGEHVHAAVGVLRIADSLGNKPTLRAFATYKQDLARWREKNEYLDADHPSPMVLSFKAGQTRRYLNVLDDPNSQLRFYSWAKRNRVKSAIYVPIPAHPTKNKLGVLSFYRSRIEPFSEEDVAYCECVAHLLAIAIQKVKNDIRHNALREIHSKLSAVARSQDLLQVACDSVRELLDVEVASIFIKHHIPGVGLFLRRASLSSNSIPNNWFEEETYEAGQGVIGKALTTFDEVVVENDVRASQKVVKATVARYNKTLRDGCRHVAAASLIGRDGSPLGVIRIMNKQDTYGRLIEGGFSNDDIDLFKMLSAVIAHAVDHVVLIEQLDSAHASLEKFDNELFQSTSLMEEGMKILLKQVQTLAIQLGLADKVGAVALRPDNSSFTGVTDFEDELPYDQRVRENGITRQVMKSGKPIFFQDVSRDRPKGVRHHPMIARHQIKSYAVLPLIVHSPIDGTRKARGAIAFFSRTVNTYTENHLRIVSTFAEQAANILSQLWAKASVNVELSHWRYKRIADELHDKLSSLDKVILKVGYIQKISDFKRYEVLDEAIDDLQRHTQTLYASFRSILDLEATEIGEHGLKVAIENWITENGIYTKNKNGIQILQKLTVSKNLDFDLSYDIYWVAINALANAIKHCGKDGLIRGKVSIALKATTKMVQLIVKDNGNGFDPKSIKSGYGLLRMYEIANRRGGTLHIDSKLGQGYTVIKFNWIKES